EIESVLGTHEAVNSAVVVAHELGAGDTRLVAYIVPESGEMDASTLREHLRVQLPDYMIPQHFMALEALPLTPNGKLDRKGLPQPDQDLSSQEYVAPRSEAEQQIASIWQTVLKTERVGIHDGFFDIGGHSLLAAAVVARLRDELGIELSLRQLFEAPTVGQLVQLVDGEGVASRSQVPALVASTKSGSVPQSYAQQRLWYLDQLEPNTAVYNMPAALRLRGELDVDALRQALNEIVRRHEVLRTTLVAGEDGIPVQQVVEQLELEVLPEELEVAAGEDKTLAARHVLESAGAEPFDLALGPLIRVRLLRLTDDDHVLLVIMHHAISDGWSLELFLKEMSELYAAFRQE
ncbi:MAG: non-ribosomal peptide synthetase, partial [Halieaceae bacterium]|nr:non-ribosomal peptide synthetase [Halieaceae bacterium]